MIFMKRYLEKILKKEGIEQKDDNMYDYHIYCYMNDGREIVELSILEFIPAEEGGKHFLAEDVIKYVELTSYNTITETIDGVFMRLPIRQLPVVKRNLFYEEIIVDYLENDGKGAIEILDKFNPWVLRD